MTRPPGAVLVAEGRRGWLMRLAERTGVTGVGVHVPGSACLLVWYVRVRG